MLLRPVHTRFDRYLSERGVLLDDSDCEHVHKFIDEGSKIRGSQHRDKDPYHDKDEHDRFRVWLNDKYNAIGQDRATDWLRSDLGHFSLDHAKDSLRRNASEKSLFDFANRSMCQKSLDGAKFYPKKRVKLSFGISIIVE